MKKTDRKYINWGKTGKNLQINFNASDSVIFNWKNGIMPVDLEDMLFYCQLAEVTLDDIIVYDRCCR